MAEQTREMPQGKPEPLAWCRLIAWRHCQKSRRLQALPLPSARYLAGSHDLSRGWPPAPPLLSAWHHLSMQSWAWRTGRPQAQLLPALASPLTAECPSRRRGRPPARPGPSPSRPPGRPRPAPRPGRPPGPPAPCASRPPTARRAAPRAARPGSPRERPWPAPWRRRTGRSRTRAHPEARSGELLLQPAAHLPIQKRQSTPDRCPETLPGRPSQSAWPHPCQQMQAGSRRPPQGQPWLSPSLPSSGQNQSQIQRPLPAHPLPSALLTGWRHCLQDRPRWHLPDPECCRQVQEHCRLQAPPQ
mmetsp:Transcript_68833/g.195023  ORF Transcript_68833/g.195023 Transcript_68833/m.195023 type:complete len:301 (+) Transcript_68833:393-1295(+)